MAACMSQDEPADEIPAATLIVFRNARTYENRPEILMVERSRELAFAGGAVVFPGGRVDLADRQLAAQMRHYFADEDEAAHRIAAIRETLEETGLAIGLRGQIDGQNAVEARNLLLEREELAPVLKCFGWSLDLDALTPFARWLPRGMTHARIFDTRFYLADLGTGAVEVEVDATENTRLFWTSAKEALASIERGDIKAIFPTIRNLERLAQFDTYEDALAQTRSIPTRIITPQIVENEAGRWLTIDDDLGYPVTREPLGKTRRE